MLVHRDPLWGATRAAKYVGVSYWTMQGWMRRALPTVRAPNSLKRLVRRSALDALKLKMEVGQ